MSLLLCLRCVDANIRLQVEILQLRNSLEAAQGRLTEMRKLSYRED